MHCYILMQDFWVSPEDQLDVFGKYYSIPSLSWRDTVHDLIAHNVSGFTVPDLYFDKAHPNGYNGHRCRFLMLLAFAPAGQQCLTVQTAAQVHLLLCSSSCTLEKHLLCSVMLLVALMWRRAVQILFRHRHRLPAE